MSRPGGNFWLEAKEHSEGAGHTPGGQSLAPLSLPRLTSPRAFWFAHSPPTRGMINHRNDGSIHPAAPSAEACLLSARPLFLGDFLSLPPFSLTFSFSFLPTSFLHPTSLPGCPFPPSIPPSFCFPAFPSLSLPPAPRTPALSSSFFPSGEQIWQLLPPWSRVQYPRDAWQELFTGKEWALGKASGRTWLWGP